MSVYIWSWWKNDISFRALREKSYYIIYRDINIRYFAYKHFASSLSLSLKNLKSRFYASTAVSRPKRDSREILKILRRATKKSCFGDRRSA